MRASTQATHHPVKNGHRIAVVESNDLVRQLLEKWLVDAGFDVKIVKLPFDPAAFDLVIADLPSPRATGPLVRSLEVDASIPVLLLSGRFRAGQGGSMPLADQLGVRYVLPKPFTRQQLLIGVFECLKTPP
jgi:DNA-binding response OmpR family regulator